MLYLVDVVVVVYFVAGAMLSLSSQDGAAAGLVDGRLSPSPETLNRVCSEYLSEGSLWMRWYSRGLPMRRGQAQMAGERLSKVPSSR